MSEAEECLSGFIHLSFESQFAKVIFQDVQEFYNTNEDVECVFTLTSQSAPQNGDKVALFKVGWSNTKDFLSAEDVIGHSGDSVSTDSRIRVVFKADNLPNDDSEFYQFCYLVADGNILGASTPFSFKSQAVDELVSVEDAENDLLIIRTRSAVREELVREITQQKDKLQKENGLLAVALGEEKQKQNELQQEFQDKIAALTVRHDKAHVDFEQSVIEFLKNELQVESSVSSSFKEAVLAAKRKQNVLESRIENLQKEKELLETRLSASNCELQTEMQKVDALKSEVNMHLKTIVEVKHLVSMLEQAHDKQLTRANKSESCLSDQEARINDLMVMMKALERSKQIATEEISKTNALAHEKITDLTANLEHCRESCAKLAEENKKLVKCLEERQQDSDEMRNVYQQTSQDAAKFKKEKEALEAKVEDLKVRLEKGGEEYRKKYIEWYRLQRKCTKLQAKLNPQERVDNSSNASVCGSIPSVHVECLAHEHEGNESTPQPNHSLDPEQKVKILAEMERQLQGFQTSRPVETSPEMVQNIREQSGMTYPYPAYYPYPYPNTSVMVPFMPVPFSYTAEATCNTFMNTSVEPESLHYEQNPYFVNGTSESNEHVSYTSLGDESARGGSILDQLNSGRPNVAVNPERVTCCPVCDIPFMTESSSTELEAHIADHFAFTCPMCGMQFEKHEGNASAIFEAHVSNHF